MSSNPPLYTKTLPTSRYHQGSIEDAARLRAVLDHIQPRVIFDFVSPQAFDLPANLYVGISITARRAMLAEVKRTPSVRACVFNSTAGVVHDSYSDLVEADESLPVLFAPEQREPYSHSKAVAETMLLEMNGTSSANNTKVKDPDSVATPLLLTAAIRICSPFGADHGEVIKPIVENARAGRYKFQMGDGKTLSDWTYVQNGTRAHVLAAQALVETANRIMATESDDSPPETLSRRDPGRRIVGEAFLITNDEHIPSWDFVRAVGAAAGYPTDESNIRIIPRSIGMCMAFVAEWMTWLLSLGRRKAAFSRTGVGFSTITRTYRIDKAKQRLGYRPEVGLQEGIKRAVRSYVETKKD